MKKAHVLQESEILVPNLVAPRGYSPDGVERVCACEQGLEESSSLQDVSQCIPPNVGVLSILSVHNEGARRILPVGQTSENPGLAGGRPAFDWSVWSGSHPESLHLTECRRDSSPPLSCPPRPAGWWSGVTNVPYPFRLRMAKVEPRRQVNSPNLACSGFPEVLRRLKWLVKRFITKARIEVL